MDRGVMERKLESLRHYLQRIVPECPTHAPAVTVTQA